MSTENEARPQTRVSLNDAVEAFKGLSPEELAAAVALIKQNPVAAQPVVETTVPVPEAEPAVILVDDVIDEPEPIYAAATPVPTTVEPAPVVEEPPVVAAVEQPVAAAPVTNDSDDALEDGVDVPSRTLTQPGCNVSLDVKQLSEFSDPATLSSGISVMRSDPEMASCYVSSDVAASDLNELMEGVTLDADGNRVYVSVEQQIRATELGAAFNSHSPIHPSGMVAGRGALVNEEANWDQRIKLGGKNAEGGETVGFARSHAKDNNSVRNVVARRRGSGIPAGIFLPHSQINLRFRPPHEVDFCELDLRLSQITEVIGRQTHGMLMSLASGLYVRHLVEFALQFVESASIDAAGMDLKTVLINTVDHDDYWLILIGLLIAKYPNGLPWRLICPLNDCGHEEPTVLNLSRCVRFGNGLYSNEQLAMLSRRRGSLSTIDDIARYRDAATAPATAKQIIEAAGAKVEFTFGKVTLGEYFDATDAWIVDNNTLTAKALSENPDEETRQLYLRTVTQARRLTRYLHLVKGVVVFDEDDNPIQAESHEIKDILTDLSGEPEFVAHFEAAVARYVEDRRLAVFGYMARPCPVCGNPTGETTGAYRGIVTMSPDRIFFTVSRVVSEIQRALQQQFDNIG